MNLFPVVTITGALEVRLVSECGSSARRPDSKSSQSPKNFIPNATQLGLARSNVSNSPGLEPSVVRWDGYKCKQILKLSSIFNSGSAQDKTRVTEVKYSEVFRYLTLFTSSWATCLPQHVPEDPVTVSGATESTLTSHVFRRLHMFCPRTPGSGQG